MKHKCIILVAPAKLKISKSYTEIYGADEEINEFLLATIKEEGIKEPLIIDSDYYIISGVLRWRAVLELQSDPTQREKFKTIPVIISDNNPSPIEVVIHNQGRVKTHSQIIREVKILKEHYTLGKGYRSDLKEGQNESKTDISELVGLSKSSISRLLSTDEMLNKIYSDDTIKKDRKLKELDNGKYSISSLQKWCSNEISKRTTIEEPQKIYQRGQMTLLNKSCEDLSDLEDNSVGCVFTSPAFYKLRHYSNGDNEFGQESSPDEFIENLVKVLNSLKSKLTRDGSLIVNIMDTTLDGSQCLIPQKLSIAMQNHSWKINTTIIWAKSNPPYSGDQRPNPSHEYIIQFYCNDTPYYNTEWINDEATEIKPIIYCSGEGPRKKKNLKSVWRMDGDIVETNVNSTQRLNMLPEIISLNIKHPALMNETIASVLINSFSKVGDLVVDIFNGGNTTGIRCEELGRKFLGYEINPAYFKFSTVRTDCVEFYQPETIKKTA